MTNFYHVKPLSSNFENYLKIIGDLEANKGYVRSKEIARIMKVKPSSVTNALQVLRKQKLITHTPYSAVTLTKKGRLTWRIIHKKYKSVKDFLTEILEVDNTTASNLACTIEHAISAQVVERFLILKQILKEDSPCGIDVLNKLQIYFRNQEEETALYETNETKRRYAMKKETVKADMGSYLNSSKERLDIIMSIVEDYFAGKDRGILTARFKNELGNKISAGEFALSEQKAGEKGVSDHQFEMEVDGLLEIFKPGLKHEKITGLPEGHPLDSFIKENIAITELLKELKENHKTVKLIKVDAKYWKTAYDKIWQIDTHYIRKENQLFPYLEKKHFLKPSKVMWTMHDKIREIIKNNRKLLEEQKYEELFNGQGKMFAAIESMMFKEEKILWETSLELLTDEEWMEIRIGEEEVGYCLIDRPKEWKI